MDCSELDFHVVVVGFPGLAVMLVVRVHISQINIIRLAVVTSLLEFNLQLVLGVITDNFAVSKLQPEA
jgi:hypothetical protein